MQKITYRVGQETGEIYWGVAEQFRELQGKEFKLGEMEAVQIEKFADLSLTAKILLSAVAGAVIQHLMDQGVEIGEILEVGVLQVCRE